MMLKKILDAYVLEKNTSTALFDAPDPLQVATKFKDPFISLICALFAYGNAKLIVKFLNSLDFTLLDESEDFIVKILKTHKYRFQTCEDVRQIFITLSRLKNSADICDIVKSGFERDGKMIDGINDLIKFIYSLNDYRSDGYEFFFGRDFKNAPISPYKRYNMYLRWMVRDSDIDLNLFKTLPKSELLMPLDVHTHRVSLNLGLINRKSYDFKAVLELTQKLREYDPKDPIKYDFALYRIGQSGELDRVCKMLNL
ncbi:TIGR02757 family protein [Campylobacter sp. faydin G-24]|uniref:TIGR02757 family protein n=2 Tax=Campylobacter anatolicus TaxID=2829105 RepID=A0ABS5HII4_9BACT|nr:TIGR02757 family protein [Campylobacter anatolicus]